MSWGPLWPLVMFRITSSNGGQSSCHSQQCGSGGRFWFHSLLTKGNFPFNNYIVNCCCWCCSSMAKQIGSCDFRTSVAPELWERFDGDTNCSGIPKHDAKRKGPSCYEVLKVHSCLSSPFLLDSQLTSLESHAGWWFGTSILFSQKYWVYVIIPIDFHSIIFQRGG